MKKIAIGCDHVGFELKEAVIRYLRERGIEVTDCGTNSTQRTDYPLYGKAVAKEIVQGRADAGILLCGTGVGISIAANKVRGIRAVVCSEPYSARLSREHNDTNVLALGSRVVGEGLAITIVEAWLNAEFEGGRHSDRVKSLE